MARRSRIIVAVLWALSLLAVGTWTRANADTQSPDNYLLQKAVLYAGEDVGIRVYTPMGGGRGPIGTLVVRVAGQWQEVQLKAVNEK